MLKIGLTGGIGSGKSTIAKLFELLGIPVYYADEASKRLYQTSEELRASLKKQFGEDIYTGEELNRRKLAEIVFSDHKQLEILNQLVHPPTIKDANEWMNQQTAPYIIKEAALLFESGSAKDLDYIIGVRSPQELRIQRVMERDSTYREHILNRMNKQMDEEEKMKRCDFIIHNDERELVIPQVLELHRKILELNKDRNAD
jgi:dephospho-CoA kinase